MTPDEALRRVRDPHNILQMTDVELTEAAVTLALEVERLRAIEARATGYTKLRGPVLPDREAVARWILNGDG